MDLLVNIDVDDLGRAERFYTSAFDLRAGRRFEGAVELVGGSSRVYLLVKAAGSAATPAEGSSRAFHRHWTPVHLDFVVEEIDRAVQQAVQAGAVLEQPVKTNAWGKLALLSDPFGHGFCLVQFVGRGYDEVVQAGGA